MKQREIYHFFHADHAPDWTVVHVSPEGQRLPLPGNDAPIRICSSEQEAFEVAVQFAARTEALIFNEIVSDQPYYQSCQCTEDLARCQTGLSLLRQAQALNRQSASFDDSRHPLAQRFGQQAIILFRQYDQHLHGYCIGDLNVTMSGPYQEPDPCYQYSIKQYTRDHLFEVITRNASLTDVVRATMGHVRYKHDSCPDQIQAAWDRAGLYRRQET